MTSEGIFPIVIDREVCSPLKTLERLTEEHGVKLELKNGRVPRKILLQILFDDEMVVQTWYDERISPHIATDESAVEALEVLDNKFSFGSKKENLPRNLNLVKHDEYTIMREEIDCAMSLRAQPLFELRAACEFYKVNYFEVTSGDLFQVFFEEECVAYVKGSNSHNTAKVGCLTALSVLKDRYENDGAKNEEATPGVAIDYLDREIAKHKSWLAPQDRDLTKIKCQPPEEILEEGEKKMEPKDAKELGKKKDINVTFKGFHRKNLQNMCVVYFDDEWVSFWKSKKLQKCIKAAIKDAVSMLKERFPDIMEETTGVTGSEENMSTTSATGDEVIQIEDDVIEIEDDDNAAEGGETEVPQKRKTEETEETGSKVMKPEVNVAAGGDNETYDKYEFSGVIS